METCILINSFELIYYSGSSAGDLGDVTPCNASPNLSALMPFRQVVRDDAEEIWRQQIQSLITQAPYNTLSFFQLLSKILRVSEKRMRIMKSEKRVRKCYEN